MGWLGQHRIVRTRRRAVTPGKASQREARLVETTIRSKMFHGSWGMEGRAGMVMGEEEPGVVEMWKPEVLHGS